MAKVNYNYNRGGSSMYRYDEPSISQYESFFNPIPLEFIQQQFDRRQGAYDQGYATALAAKDMYSGVEVGENDIINKNNIVNEFVNNTDRLVQEKYGGDWGRAAKEVARTVTDVRQNPFWDTAKILKSRQEEERQLVQKYGPKALQFKSVQGIGAIDPTTGKVRRPEELDFDVQEQGDWQGYMKTVLQSINPDQYDLGLTETEKGYLRDGNWAGIKKEKLDKIINTPEVIRAFVNSNPDFERAVKAGLRYGDKEGNVEEAAKDFFRGNLYPTEFSKKTSNLVQDWQLKQSMENVAKDNPYYGSTSELPVVANMQTALKEHRRKTKGFSYVNGSAQGRGEITDEKRKELDNIYAMYNKPQFIDERGINQTLQTALLDFNNSLTDKDYYTPDKYYNELVAQYPELAQMSQEKAFKAYDNYLTNMEKESRVVSNIILDKSPERVKTTLLSNLNSGNFGSYKFRSTGDTFDNKSIVKELGYTNVDEFTEKIKDKNIAPRADFRQGQMLINVPNKKGEMIDVYFDPDIETKSILQVGQAINEFYYDPKTYTTENTKPVPIPNSNIGFAVVGEGSIQGNNKQIFLVRLDSQGNIDESVEPEPISIQRAYHRLTGLIDERLSKMGETK